MITMTKEYANKVVVITGGAQGIGRCMVETFKAEGARVAVVDLQPSPQGQPLADLYVQGDLADKVVLDHFADKTLECFGHVDILVNNAMPLFKGIAECSYEEFCYAQQVGVVAPFYLAKRFAPHIPPGGSIVNISSSRDRMSMPQTESYTAAKGGIAALTHALAVSLGPGIRVNAVAPGWIDTVGAAGEGADALQQPCGRVGRVEDIAQTVLFLCSRRAGFITGENICVDGGMTRQMVYHGENGWSYDPEGR